jgi:sugar/nucleoside kinase (ribokinase family)
MSKKYDVYGLGNALLDIECEVSVESLNALGLDKGVMTLLDETHQNDILAHLEAYPKKQSCGGSAANTIIAISQFGGQTYYTCKVADDSLGAIYRDDLIRCGVDTNLAVQSAPEGITGKCLVLVTPDADRTMGTFLGISAQLSTADMVTDVIAHATYTYLEGYLVSGEQSLQAALKARSIAQAAGCKVALSLSDLNMVKFFKPGLLAIIGSGVDLLFANESEALAMAETQDLGQAIDHLKSLATCFALTRGPQGSLIFDGETVHEIAPYPVQAVDTVGAGDMYAGAVLYGITHGMTWVEAGRLGSMASAKLVTNLGPRMPTEDLQSILNQVLTS